MIKYGFIFEPDTTWMNKSTFEQDLGQFFRGKGYKASMIKTAEGQEDVPMIYLEKQTQEVETKLEFKEKDGKPTSKA